MSLPRPFPVKLCLCWPSQRATVCNDTIMMQKNDMLYEMLRSCVCAAVTFKGETKRFSPEEISSMVLAKMRDVAQVTPFDTNPLLCAV